MFNEKWRFALLVVVLLVAIPVVASEGLYDSAHGYAAEIEDPVRFDTECGEAAVPPAVFADVLCLGLCMEGSGRVGCRHSEARGTWYDRPAARINTIVIKIVGMVEVEDLAGQLEGHTGWEVVVDSVNEKLLLENGEWRVTWPELAELKLELEGWGKIRIVPDDNARRLVVGSALLTPEDYEEEVRELESAANSGDVAAPITSECCTSRAKAYRKVTRKPSSGGAEQPSVGAPLHRALSVGCTTKGGA